MSILRTLPRPTKALKNFYVFDTETAKRLKNGRLAWCLDGELIFGVLYGLNYTKIFYSKDEFLNELKDKRFNKSTIFAHNAKFDLEVIFDNLYNLIKVIFNSCRFIQGKWHNEITFADSANIFVGLGVKELGKMLGLEKQVLGDQDYTTDWEDEKERADAINYCIRDCEVVHEGLIRMFNFAGAIRTTQASLSMQYFRRYKQPYNFEYNEYNEKFRLSYYGGRTEAFKIGKTNSICIDVNSMYPNAMLKATFPNPRNTRIINTVSLKKLRHYLEVFEGMVYADVTHKETKYGFLPCRKDGKLIFPTGDFSGAWNFNEFKFALDNEVIKVNKIHYVVISEKIPSPFEDFVLTLNRMKIQAEIEDNKFERDRAKRFSNSLYGKFAQQIDEETIYIKDYEKDFHLIEDAQRNNTFLKFHTFNINRTDGYLTVKSDIKTPSYCIPSFASYITSYARIELLKALLEYDTCKPVYCDTDSIFLELPMFIESTNELGGWKVEKKIITEIKGLKNYKFKPYKEAGEVWRVKGVPVNRGKKTRIVNDGEITEIDTVSQVGPNDFIYYNIAGSKEALIRQVKTRSIQKRVKHIADKYDKREVLKDGETKPIKL